MIHTSNSLSIYSDFFYFFFLSFGFSPFIIEAPFSPYSFPFSIKCPNDSLISLVSNLKHKNSLPSTVIVIMIAWANHQLNYAGNLYSIQVKKK